MPKKASISNGVTGQEPAGEVLPAVKEAKADEELESVTGAQHQADSSITAVKAAKAGKRSEKSRKAVEEKQAKEARKAEAKDSDGEPRAKTAKLTRSRLERRGKNYRLAAENIEKGKQYTLKEALELAVKSSPARFDASVELHVPLGVDPRQADQNLRDTIQLPEGTGKTLRVAVFAETDDAAAAKKAGADIAATDEFLQQLEKGIIDFDILIATPKVMAKLGKHARLLGPKGLMPNPKSGTVTPDVAKAVREAKAGRVEYRVDSTGIVHVAIGKVSFGAERLEKNARAVLYSIKNNKPASIKGAYVKAIYATTTMGPSFRINTGEAA